MKHGLRIAVILLALPLAALAEPAPDNAVSGAPGTPEQTVPQAPVVMPVMGPAAVTTAPVDGVSLVPKTVREGYFEVADCQSSGGAAFNECLCKAAIQKAEIIGLQSPAATAAINKKMAEVPEQLANESCQGTSVPAPKSEINMNETGAGFSVPYQTSKVLTALVTYMTYGAGSAHPMSGTEGYTFDTATGEVIDPVDRLDAAKLEKLNGFVQSELAKKYGDSLFDEAKIRTDPYVTAHGCDSCTLYYTKEGWNLRFQLYAIAPYSAGEPTITIPADLSPPPESK